MRERQSIDFQKLFERLWNGKKVLCTECEKGYLITPYVEVEKPSYYYCNYCKAKLISNYPPSL